MASTINAISTGGGGIATTADATGILQLQTNGTTAVTVNASQVVSLANALPIASGGTGSTSTTFANLTTNVTGTLPIANGGTGLTAPGTSGNFLTSDGTSWVSSPAPSGTVYATDTQTLTNKRITPRSVTTTSNATPTINTDVTDIYGLTAQAEAITSFTTNLTGSPTDGQKLWIYIVGTAARAITWGAKFESSTVTLPTTTVSTARLDVGFIWNAVSLTWRCVAVS